MTVTLARRAVPFPVTTMLVAAPVFAQTAGGPSGSEVAGPGATAPATPRAPHAASGKPAGAAPSGTAQKAAPRTKQATTDGQHGESMHTLVERRLSDLHGRLQITAQQSQPWEQFAQVMRDNARQMDDAYRQRAEKFETMSAVDNMASFAQIEQQRAHNTQNLVPAFQNLYAALSDQQKQTADQLFRNYAEKAQTRRHGAAAAK